MRRVHGAPWDFVLDEREGSLWLTVLARTPSSVRHRWVTPPA
jgi:hypothetical protein